MKKLLFLILLPLSCFSQFKKELPSYITSYLSGALDGTSETIKWHYYEFEESFPNANPMFWNPKYSSQNKYKDGITSHGPKYFGSTSFLAWTTDGYHLTRTSRNFLLVSTILLHPKEKKRFKYYVKDVVIHTLIYQIGFTTTYGLIFKSRLIK